MRLVIIDGNAIIHRAYHAIPPMHTKGGVMVNAVYGFTSMLLKVWKDLKPTHIAVTFDVAGGSTARLEKFKEYKGKRVKADQELYDQIPLVHEVVAAFSWPIYEKQGYEADDVIGTIVEKMKDQRLKTKDCEVYVVTGDMDTLQLVQDNVKVYTLRKGMSDIVIYDEQEVKNRYGFGPELVVDYKALRGDASDNIPGVPGIGEKTATELIQKIGGVDEIYKKIGKLKEYTFSDSVIKKLETGKDSAFMSKEIAAIDCNVPGIDFNLDDCAVKNFDREKVLAAFQKFEFVSLMKRVPGLEEEGAKNMEQGTKEAKPKERKPKADDFVFHEIKTNEDLNGLLKMIGEQNKFACRAVVTGNDLFTSELKGLVIVVGGKGYHVPQNFLKEAVEIFSNSDVELVGHDLKHLIKILNCHSERSEVSRSRTGESLSNDSVAKRTEIFRSAQDDSKKGGLLVQNKLFDAMIASYLINPGSRAHDIPSIVLKVLGKELTASSGQESLFGADVRVLAHELYLIALAAEELRKELIKSDNLGLLQTVEMPLIPVLAEMELNGVALDREKLAELSAKVKKQLDSVTKKIYDYAGQEFNIASPVQLREILFEKLEIPVEGIKKGKTGLSTSAEQLEKMRGLHPIIDEIEIFRELAKLQNTYIDVLPTLINKTTNRIHTTFNQAVAATGRLSSTDPNLQNIPIRTALGREIREAFIAEPGNVLISADYSQIELRIVASLAQDKKMMEIFEKGEDIHAATAATINNVPLSEVTKDMRRAAKEINFGILYGMGTHGLSWRAEIPYAQAKAFIEKYFSEFSGVKKYMDQTLEFTKKEGYCETLFGRRRYIPELASQNYQLRAAAERMAINHPIQGTAADLMKMGMIEVSRVIARSEATRQSPGRSAKEIKLTLQVHDELVLEVPEGKAEEIGKLVKETMENVAKLRVPIEVHVSKGKSWGKMEKM